MSEMQSRRRYSRKALVRATRAAAGLETLERRELLTSNPDLFAPMVTSFAKNILPATTLTFTASDFTNHYSDQDGDPLVSITLLEADAPKHGTLRLNGNVIVFSPINGDVTIAAADLGNLTYTPDAGFHQADTFQWTASDGEESSASQNTNGTATTQINVGSLSVAGQTDSGNVTIGSGDTTPTATDDTDFGPDGTSTTRAVVTRTYTITNNTGSTINLTGANGKFVTVTGGNASDFVVTQPSGGTLAAGATTTFTITFKPSGTGIRKTTVSILDSAAGESPYTFAIQGRGVSLTTKADGVQIGTITAGTGTGAVVNDSLEVNYTATLLDGTPVQTNAFNPDGTQPYQFIIGTGANGAAVAGWDEGLVGIKAGETRVLFIPASQAFGDAGSGNVPAGATVVYTITAASISHPVLVVKGADSTVIPAGDKVTSLANGTNFGTTTVGGNGTLNSTFHLTDGGAGILTLTGSKVTITGTDKASFQITTMPDDPGANGNLTIAFDPTGTHGFKAATVNIFTNDPAHPTYSFAIQAGFYVLDLVPTIGTTNFPVTPVISGSGKSITVPVKVTNNGPDAVPSGLSTDIQIWAHPSGSGSSDVLVQTFTESVAGIAANGSKTFNLAVVPPLGFDDEASGSFTFFAKINQTGNVTETNTGNDTSAASSQSVTITAGEMDIQGNLVSTTILPQIATGNTTSNRSGAVTISLKNVGNLPLPSSQKVSVQLVLVPQNSGSLTTLGTFTQSVGGLTATAKNYTFNVKLPTNLDAGMADTYQIEAIVTPVTAIVTDDAGNNTLTQTATGGTLGFTIAAPFNNIGGTIGKTTLSPVSGVANQAVTGNVTVNVTNLGNTKLPASQKVTITLFARNVTDDADNGVELNTAIASKLYSVASLDLNKSMAFTIPVTLPGGLAIGTYHIEAVITPSPALVESTTADNHVTGDVNGNAVVYTVAPITNNLVADHLTVASSLTKTRLASVNATGSVAVRITNAGNVQLPQGQTVTIQFVARPAAGGNDVVLKTIDASLSLWKVGQNSTFTTNVSTAGLGLTAGTYDILAIVTPDQTLTESSTSDNTSPEEITMTLT